MANQLKYLVIHATATPEGREVTPSDIYQWHVKERGWSRPGYRVLIDLDGFVHTLRQANDDALVQNDEITNGARGYNGVSHHIAYAGGMKGDMSGPCDTRTQAQKDAMQAVVEYYINDMAPSILVCGHNQLSTAGSKACPSFWVPDWLRSIGVKERNILNANPNEHNLKKFVTC